MMGQRNNVDKQQVDLLAETIADELPFAFKALLEKNVNERPYGFCLYTDDSAMALDVAVNTVEGLSRFEHKRHYDAFEAYWYSTEWAYEGGAAGLLTNSHQLIENREPDWDSSCEEEINIFRESVFESMVKAMSLLLGRGFFDELALAEERVLQVCISDSEDDERIMEYSLEKLNPLNVFSRYLEEKTEAYS